MWNYINQAEWFMSAIGTFRAICESVSVFWCIFGLRVGHVGDFRVTSVAVCSGWLRVAPRRRRSCFVASHPGPLCCTSAGESQLPTKLAVLSLEIRRICASLLLRGLPDRFRNGVTRSHAVHLLACSADCRPLHCRERVRSPRIAYSRELSLMCEIALILDVHFGFRPT